MAGMLGFASIGVAFFIRPAKQSPVALVTAVSPALLMLLLFYSLVIHLHHHLGGWPANLGNHNYSPALATHEDIAGSYFWILALLNVLVWPVAYTLCALIRRRRACLYYFGVYALAYFVCLGVTLLAPSRFWEWFRD